MKFLDHLEEWLIAFLMGAATLLIFVAVVHRYAAGLPIPGVQDALLKIDLTWAQELCIYMFVWMAKFGAAYGVRTGIHVGVDVMINRLPPGTRKLYVLFGLLAGATFTAIVGTLGATFVWDIALNADELIGLLGTLSWVILTPDDERVRLFDTARRLLAELLGVEGEVTVDVAYRAVAFRTFRRD